MKTTNVDVHLKKEMRINYHCSSGPEENHENYKKKDSVLVHILNNRLPNIHSRIIILELILKYKKSVGLICYS